MTEEYIAQLQTRISNIGPRLSHTTESLKAR